MSGISHITQKRPVARKNNVPADSDRNEPESSSHGRTRIQYSEAEQGPEKARKQRNDAYSRASVRFKLPNLTTTISTVSAHKSGEDFPPLSDTELDFDRAQSDSSDNLSPPNTSHYSSQRSEIRRLQQEVAALKERQDQLLLAESMWDKCFKDLKRKSEADVSYSNKLTTELDQIRASYNRVKEHLQCQICLEMFKSPWTLSPCGHVGCLECLLNWFTTRQDDEDATDPIHREKTCPQCRALIVLPPTPSYVLKNVIEEIESSGSATQPRSTPVATIVNPWSKIFSLANEQQDDDDDDDDEGEEAYSDGRSYDEDDSDAASSDSPSESSDYHTEFQAHMEHLDQVMTWEIEMRNEATAWTEPTWQPPRFDSRIVEVSPDDAIIPFLSAAEILSLLRRGATREMIRRFNLSYEHHTGVVSRTAPNVIPNVNLSVNIRLGWNISRNSDDSDGRVYMRAVLNELKDYPERFRIESTPGERTVVRLLPSLGGPDYSDDVDD